MKQQSSQTSRQFLIDTFKYWNFSSDTVSLVEQNSRRPRRISPLDMPWGRMTTDIDAGKVGQYTINPEVPRDFSEKRMHIPFRQELQSLEGRPLFEVAALVSARYGRTHIIPGIEYWKYVFENPDKAPGLLKDGNYHYFFGSVFRGSVGDWDVPIAHRGSSRLRRYGHWLVGPWVSCGRVVLLEK
ncbi:MAG: hypothetical protein HYX22_00215 [Candidatus Yanofskybacteria bacterium]|nr:hypothetical protein [Candidatus Yanofskybacteria bacterium]